MTDAAQARDDLLLSRLARGDQEAFLTLYRRHQRPLYRYALHMIGRPEAAEEVVQEVFMAIVRDGAKFDPKRGEFAAFLFGIARNHVHRLLEADGRYQALPDEGPDGLLAQAPAPLSLAKPDLLDSLVRAQVAEQVRRAVLSLPVRYREVVTLCDLEEMEYAHAAAILNCPLGTVRSRLNRARDMLADKLRPSLAPEMLTRPSGERAFDTG